LRRRVVADFADCRVEVGECCFVRFVVLQSCAQFVERPTGRRDGVFFRQPFDGLTAYRDRLRDFPRFLSLFPRKFGQNERLQFGEGNRRGRLRRLRRLRLRRRAQGLRRRAKPKVGLRQIAELCAALVRFVTFRPQPRALERVVLSLEVFGERRRRRNLAISRFAGSLFEVFLRLVVVF